MFDSPVEARAVLAENFPKAQVEQVVSALVPAIGFLPVPGGTAVLGGTRIGGAPDLPPHLAWPKRTKPADAEAIAKRGSASANTQMAEHFRLELPYAFLAQVDLTEAAALGPVARDLPNEGRLLVFYDLVTGPYDTGSETVRVIWDTSPRETLVAQEPPPALKEAAERTRRETVEEFKKAGLEPPSRERGGGSTPYHSPARAMRLKAAWRLADGYAGDMEAYPALKQLWEKDAFRDKYQRVIARYFDPYYGAANRGRRNQFLGSANPEQDDPRYDAVVVTRFGVQHLERDVWRARFPEIQAEAKQWRLLLQIDCSDHAQDSLVEGTIYVLIREDDLKERRFERAVAVYQQT